MRIKFALILLFFAGFASLAEAKDFYSPRSGKFSFVATADTLTKNTNSISNDTLASSRDSLLTANSDSTGVADSTKSKGGFNDVKAVIYSSGTDSLIFDIKNKKMSIYGKGDVKYQKSELKSGKIKVDFTTNELIAYGVPDKEDSTGKKIVQNPVMIDNGETYEGAALKYNFKTKQGFISVAKNKEDKQYYKGEAVKKVTKNVYFIKNGMYTTCKSDTPVTYFTAKQMKVIQKDRIIAKWIWMYIGGVPLPLPLPFGVFPNRGGRRSGIIPPGYGMDARRGQYFHNFGYFWAISDYMDLALTGDYYTKGGWGARQRFRYAKRYSFSGNFNAGISRIIIGEPEDPKRQEQTDWNISWFHNQRFNPTTRLDVNLRFQTSNFYRNNSIDYNSLLRRNIVSNATFSKRWEESRNSLTINYNRVQNLDNGTISELLPGITFNKAQSYPFRSKTAVPGKMKWYEYIGYSYTGRFINKRIKNNTGLHIRGGIQHSFSVSASPKIAHLNISPHLSYTEKWYNKRTRKKLVAVPQDSTYVYRVEDEDVHEINFVRTFNFGVTASTKIYGIAQPEMLGIKAFRHTVSPSISYNYSPDFSAEKWGYYDVYYDKNGKEVRYDKFGREIFGGVPSRESQRLSFSVGNLFEMKTMKDPTDTTSKEKKYRLLNLTAGISYDFAADSNKLSDLSLSYRTQLGKYLNFYGSSGYTFYDYNGSRRINKFLLSQGKGLLRFNRMSLSISTSISGEKLKGKEDKKEKQKGEEEPPAFRKKDYISLFGEEQPVDFKIPWSLSLNLNYNISKPTPNYVSKTASIGLNLAFNLTPKWRFNVSGNYDLIRKEISAPAVSIYRDMDCWEMRFNWNPLGIYRGFHFEIRMKAPELRDIKVTKTKGLYSGRR